MATIQTIQTTTGSGSAAATGSATFICYRCSKTFNQKVHLTNHLKRKKSCPATKLDVPAEVLLNDLVQQQKNNSSQPPPPPISSTSFSSTSSSLSSQDTETQDAAAAAAAAATATPAAVTNHGGINIFIFPNSENSSKIISSVDFKDINTAIHSLLGLLLPPPISQN